MNLFNQLNHRYGQSCIEEVRSWEGKEQKLARHKCHLHFNLRCLSQNIVPKGVKLNIKQFSTFQERKIIWKHTDLSYTAVSDTATELSRNYKHT